MKKFAALLMALVLCLSATAVLADALTKFLNGFPQFPHVPRLPCQILKKIRTF